MKKTILILSTICLFSCTKDWSCEIETSSTYVNSTYQIDFRGTTEEKNEYEQAGTTSTPDGDGGTIDLKTTCYAD
jgi:hypothetical protein